MDVFNKLYVNDETSNNEHDWTCKISECFASQYNAKQM